MNVMHIHLSLTDWVRKHIQIYPPDKSAEMFPVKVTTRESQ
jgi:hypothetical protein